MKKPSRVTPQELHFLILGQDVADRAHEVRRRINGRVARTLRRALKTDFQERPTSAIQPDRVLEPTIDAQAHP